MDNFDKTIVAKNLRGIMAQALISSEELAKKVNLSRHQIDNILYCRALKLDNVKKIADFFEINVEKLLAQHNLKEQTNPLDIKIYSQIISTIDKVLSFYKLKTSKHNIEIISTIVYKDYKNINNLEEVIKGMVLLLNHFGRDIEKSS